MTLVKTEQQPQLVRYETDRGEVALSTELVRRLFCPTATPAEAYSFIQLCRYHRLNPHLKEAYLVKYSERDPASFIIGKEAWLSRAEGHSQYEGFKAGIILKADDGLDYRASSFKTPDETLLGGWCEVYRKDRLEPVRIEVALQEYDRGRSLWNSHKATMIRKVAISQAHREAFPGMFAGLYEQAEISDEGPLNEDMVVESTGTWLDKESVDPDTGEIVSDVSAPPKPKPRNDEIRERTVAPSTPKRLSQDLPPKKAYNAPNQTLRRMNDERVKAGLTVEQVEEWVKTNFEVHQIADLTEGQVDQVTAAILNRSIRSAQDQEQAKQDAVAGMFRYAEAYSITPEQCQDYAMNTWRVGIDQVTEDQANSIRGAIQTGLLSPIHQPSPSAMANPNPDAEHETPEKTPQQEMIEQNSQENTLPLLPFIEDTE